MLSTGWYQLSLCSPLRLGVSNPGCALLTLPAGRRCYSTMGGHRLSFVSISSCSTCCGPTTGSGWILGLRHIKFAFSPKASFGALISSTGAFARCGPTTGSGWILGLRHIEFAFSPKASFGALISPTGIFASRRLDQPKTAWGRGRPPFEPHPLPGRAGGAQRLSCRDIRPPWAMYPQLDSSRFLLGRPPWVGWQALRLLAHHLRLATRVESRAPVEVVNPRRRVCPCTGASLTGGSCRCLRSRRLRAGKRRALRTFRLRRLLILWSAMDTWARKGGVARRRLGLSSLTMLITVIAMLPRPLALRI